MPNLGHRVPKKKRNIRKTMEEPMSLPECMTTSFTLNNGIKMPKVGLGTYKIRGSMDIELAVDTALDAGYRLFDTAAVYKNEVALGEAFSKLLVKYNLQREDIFVTTKLAPSELGKYNSVSAAYQKSIDNLGIGYADLYMIHFPASARMSPHDVRNPNLRRDTWAALTQLYEEGRVNAIGVANFNVKHLRDMNIGPGDVTPAVNQVEWHPHYYQEDLLAYCRQREICIQAYSSLGGASSGDQALLEDPAVKRIAHDHGTGEAQVLLAWALQQDIAVIPKSKNPQRVRDNARLDFTLTEREMRTLSALRESGKKYAWDPSNIR